MKKHIKTSDDLRSHADLDSRAGEPLGMMRAAADLIDEMEKALQKVVEWHGKRGYENPEAPDTLLPADEQEPEIADALRLLAKMNGSRA